MTVQAMDDWTGTGPSGFHALVMSVERRAERSFGAGGPVFRVNTEDLFDVFLDVFADPVVRQHHRCSCCRRFIERWGGAVAIESDASLRRRGFAVYGDCRVFSGVAGD